MSTTLQGAPGQACDLEGAQHLVAWFESRAQARGLALRQPPPQPTTCCGRGCNGCVWESYYAALAYWRECALSQLG